MARKKQKKRSDEEILKEALVQLASAERHMVPIMERIRRARLVCLGRSNSQYGKPRDADDPRDWRSREFPPIANEHHELLSAELTVDDPRFEFIARDVQFDDAADQAEDALDYYHDRDRFARTFRLAMRATCRDGGQVIKTIWANDSCIEFGPDGKPVTDDNGDTSYVNTYSGIRHILCRAEDIFPDPTATDFDDARFVFHRTRATIDDLRSRTTSDGDPFYENLDKLTKNGGGDDQGDEKRPNETTEAFDARRTGLHTLHERWTPYGRITIANRTHIIRRDNKLPFKHGKVPFTMIRVIDDEDCIFGVSPMNLIDGTQEAYWFLLNCLYDAVHLAVCPPMLVDIEEDPRSPEYEIRPNARIPARNGESTVKVLQDVANLDKYNIANLMENLRGLMERITGMNAAIAGASQASTATEAAINVRQGKGRVSAMMNVSDECWSQLASKAYSLIQQFGSEEVSAQLRGGRKVAFKPEELVDMMIVPRPASSERALKDLERQDKRALWDLVASVMTDPVTQMPQIDAVKVLSDVIDALGGDARSVVVGPPKPPAALPAPAPAPTVASGTAGDPSLDAAGNPAAFLDEAGMAIDPAQIPSMMGQAGA